MFGFQSHLIFPVHAVPKAGALPAGVERLHLDVPGGDPLEGMHFRPVRAGRGPATLVLVFAGNAWNSQDAAAFVHELYPRAHVIAFHYRGYRPSSGSPSAKALLDDAPRVFDFAVDRVQPAQTIGVGLSIGSGVAAHLATKRPLDGLVLVTPFDSLKQVAQDLYPWLPIGPFFEHEVDAAAALARSETPTAIIAGERDELVRAARTDALRAAARNLVFDRTIPRAGHNDLYARSDFHAAMRDALAAVTG